MLKRNSISKIHAIAFKYKKSEKMTTIEFCYCIGNDIGCLIRTLFDRNFK